MTKISTGHVFMSYSRKDEAVTRRITQFLRGQGVNVWVDNEKLVPGTPIWEVEIENAIHSASAVVVVLSPDSKKSVWVRREISFAERYQKRVFPIMVAGDENSSITLRLSVSQYVDIRGNEEIGLNSLKTALSIYMEGLEAREKVEQEAVQLAKEKAEREAIEKSAREKAERDNAENSAKEKANRERRAREEAERTAAQKAEEERLVKKDTSAATQEFKYRTPAPKVETRQPQSTRPPWFAIGVASTAIIGVLLFGYMVYKLIQNIPTATPSETQVPSRPTEAMTTDLPPFSGKSLIAPNCDYGGNIKSIEAVEQYTVKFIFCAPEPAFIAKIGSSEAFDIYDQDYLQEIGGDAGKMNENPVGTGPYIVQEWVRGDHITLIPNPNYFGEKPTNRTFTIKWNPESSARLLDLQAGVVSGIAEVTSDDLAVIQADPNLKLYPRKINNFLYLGINNTKPPFDNERVRQALAIAINKQALVDYFYPPGSVIATQFIPLGVKPGFTDGFVDAYYDPQKAQAMFYEVGFDFSREYTLSYADRTHTYFPYPTKIAQAVQAQLAEIGIKVKLEMEEWATYVPATRAGKKELFFLGWTEDYPDATDWYDVFLMGSITSFGAPFPDIMDNIQKAAQSGDPVYRQQVYDEVNKLYALHVPNIVIAHGATNLAFLSSVENVVIGPYNENFPQIKTADGTLVFSQDGEPVSLFCADEKDRNSFRVCNQIFSKLYTFEWGTATPKPDLAEACTGNADATEWTCTLKQGVLFSNGATLDANDVVVSFSAGLDYNNPLRKGNTGYYQYFKDFFGPKVMNEPAQ